MSMGARWTAYALLAGAAVSSLPSPPLALAQRPIRPFWDPVPQSADPRRDTPASGRPSELDYAVEASLALDSGSLPGRRALGLELGANLRSRLLGGRLTVLAFPEKHVTPGSEDGGAFSLFGASASGCVASSRTGAPPVAVQLCGGLEAGRLHGRGNGLGRPDAESSLWLTPRADASLLFGPSALRGFARIGGGWPLVRQAFKLGGDGVLHQADALTWRASLGLEF